MDATTTTPLGDEALPPAADAAPDDAGSAAAEDDDEQVERFYALLASIRAVRGMLVGSSPASASAGTATAEGRKRPRQAEPPWRPAFRMEDFELEVDSAAAAAAGRARDKRKRESVSYSSATTTRPSPPAATEPTDGGDERKDGEVVEPAKPKKAHADAARSSGEACAHTDRLGAKLEVAGRRSRC